MHGAVTNRSYRVRGNYQITEYVFNLHQTAPTGSGETIKLPKYVFNLHTVCATESVEHQLFSMKNGLCVPKILQVATWVK